MKLIAGYVVQSIMNWMQTILLTVLFFSFGQLCCTENEHKKKTPHTIEKIPAGTVRLVGLKYRRPFQFVSNHNYLSGGSCIKITDADNKPLPFCLDNNSSSPNYKRVFIGPSVTDKDAIMLTQKSDVALLGALLKESLDNSEESSDNIRDILTQFSFSIQSYQ